MVELFQKEIKRISSLKQKKYRDKYNQFIVEGIKPVRELFCSGFIPEMVIIDKGKDLDLNYFTGFTKLYSCEKFEKISTLESSEGILAVYSKPNVEKSITEGSEKHLLLHDINDPGNMGTLIRTAVWFGVDSIILSGSCTDPFSPKSVRSSMGQIFDIKFVKPDDCYSYLESLKDQYSIISTFISEPNSYSDTIIGKRVLMIGSEANGLPDSYKSLSTINFFIKSFSNTESLNASVAAGISMYEIFGR